MDVTQYVLYGVPAIAVVIALVRVARETGLPAKYAPAMSIGLGMVVGAALAYQAGTPLFMGIPAGVALGAMACGIYDVGKKSTEESPITEEKTSDDEEAG